MIRKDYYICCVSFLGIFCCNNRSVSTTPVVVPDQIANSYPSDFGMKAVDYSISKDCDKTFDGDVLEEENEVVKTVLNCLNGFSNNDFVFNQEELARVTVGKPYKWYFANKENEIDFKSLVNYWRVPIILDNKYRAMVYVKDLHCFSWGAVGLAEALDKIEDEIFGKERETKIQKKIFLQGAPMGSGFKYCVIFNVDIDNDTSQYQQITAYNLFNLPREGTVAECLTPKR